VTPLKLSPSPVAAHDDAACNLERTRFFIVDGEIPKLPAGNTEIRKSQSRLRQPQVFTSSSDNRTATMFRH
jgi:hypothetical protein